MKKKACSFQNQILMMIATNEKFLVLSNQMQIVFAFSIENKFIFLFKCYILSRMIRVNCYCFIEFVVIFFSSAIFTQMTQLKCCYLFAEYSSSYYLFSICFLPFKSGLKLYLYLNSKQQQITTFQQLKYQIVNTIHKRW